MLMQAQEILPFIRLSVPSPSTLGLGQEGSLDGLAAILASGGGGAVCLGPDPVPPLRKRNDFIIVQATRRESID